jgi:hypothetical protein
VFEVEGFTDARLGAAIGRAAADACAKVRRRPARKGRSAGAEESAIHRPGRDVIGEAGFSGASYSASGEKDLKRR